MFLTAPGVTSSLPMGDTYQQQQGQQVNCGSNVLVHFPFPAYDCQEEYMRKVVQACENRQNALLESPTGTGKTLCLLCAVLAWRDGYAERNASKIATRQQEDKAYHAWTDDAAAKDLQDTLPRIFYTSRTHSQLKQVTKELKKTGYRPRAAVIAGREQLCVHPLVSKQKGMKQSAMCGQFCANTRHNKKQQNAGPSYSISNLGSASAAPSSAGGTCSYYMSVFTKRYQAVLGDTSLLDIEELQKVCRDNYVCPFFKSREDAKEAVLLMCPYNYVLDPVARNALGISLRNAIVIFDEGHNIDSICEATQGFELSHRDIAFVESEILDCVGDVEEGGARHLVHHPEDADTEGATAGKIAKEEMLMLLGLLKQKVVSLEKVLCEIDMPERDANNNTTVKIGTIRGQEGEELNNVGYRERLYPKGAAILDLFEAAGITVVEYKALKDACDKVISIIAMAKSLGGADVHGRSAKCTEKFQKILSSLFETEKAFQQHTAEGEGSGVLGPGAPAAASFGISRNAKKQLQVSEQDVAEKAQRYREEKRKLLDEHFRVQIIEQVRTATPQDGAAEPDFKRRKRNNVGWNLDNVAGDREESDFRRTLFFWCFTSKPAMTDLQDQGVRSIIITSGTLSPLTSTKKSLGVPFNVELSNRHVIKQSQVMAQVIPRGPTNREWLGTFQNRQNAQNYAQYLQDLGSGLANFAKVCPAGFLVAFSSYSLMEQILKNWTDNGIKQRIEKSKKVLCEPRKQAEMHKVWQEYVALCQEGEPGAVLCAVARGKLTEGLDFTDRQCRLVAVVGLPFPSLYDQRVVLKQQFLRETNLCDPSEWYSQQALRAINQTVGRVIRHQNDYGAVLLCDKRFCNHTNHSQLSSWLQGSLRLPDARNEYRGSFGKAFKEVHAFFEHFNPQSDATRRGTTSSTAKADVGALAAQLAGGDVIAGSNGQLSSSYDSGANGSSLANHLPLLHDDRHQRSFLTKEVTAAGPAGGLEQDALHAHQPSASSPYNRALRIRASDRLEKQGWMDLVKQVLDEDDFEELSTECLPGLRKQIPMILQLVKANPALQISLTNKKPNVISADTQHNSGASAGMSSAIKSTAAAQSEAIEQHPAIRQYKATIQQIRTLLLPAICVDNETDTARRRQLVFNFRQFLHPKFRSFWRADCERWIREKRIGAWAEDIFVSGEL
ncbi:unnamed protein product [Amoebophrya sp. A120]|nr:unnamed protein product [Amoebophrya sp. A120]|eukprot:GSA120T00004361001.1